MLRTPEQEKQLQKNAAMSMRYKFSPVTELRVLRAAVVKVGGPHVVIDNPPYDWTWLRGTVDFQIEKYPLTEEAREYLTLEAYTKGVAMLVGNQWAVLPPTLRDPIPITGSEAASYAVLPTFWRDYLVVEK
jgi:hypothetical protein